MEFGGGFLICGVSDATAKPAPLWLYSGRNELRKERLQKENDRSDDTSWEGFGSMVRRIFTTAWNCYLQRVWSRYAIFVMWMDALYGENIRSRAKARSGWLQCIV